MPSISAAKRRRSTKRCMALPLDLTLVNTVIRIKELDPDNEADHMLLWEFRDNVQAIWEDRAVQVSLTDLNHFISLDNF